MNKIGIVAGSGVLPHMVAKALTSSNNEVYIACLTPYADILGFREYNHEIFNVGHIGKIFKYFKSNQIEDILIIGAVHRLKFSDISADITGAKLLTKIVASKFLGDDTLLKIIAKFVESYGFNIKSPLDYINNDAEITKSKPSKSDLDSIEYGIKAVTELGKLDIGQSAIVENGHILGIEAAEGTNELIKRCQNYQKETKKAILVKKMKPNQDSRLDVPVVGPETIDTIHKSGMCGIAIEKSSVIILDPEIVYDKANKLGVFIHLF